MNFLTRNKIFLAIIIGAVIIGGCVYFALSSGRAPRRMTGWVQPEKSGTSDVPPISQKIVKSDLTATISCGAENNTIVTKVIDGDTVVVEGGYHVRLLGMDADEKGYPCYDQARIRLEGLVLSKQVSLEKDKTDLDQYGRCLRYIFVGSENIDVQLAREGLAVARFYEPDTKYKAEITAAEKYAQQNYLGCKWEQ